MNILAYAVVAYVALYYLKKKWLDVRTARHISDLKVVVYVCHLWDSEIPIDVFVDTGNGCTEPLSGLPVHFVSLKAVEAYIPEDLRIRCSNGIRMVRLH